MSKSNTMVHVSFDVVDRFIPRVPTSRLPNENAEILRICVAPNIHKALQAMPMAGETIEMMQTIGMPVVIHAYYLKSSHILTNEDLDRWELVPDASITGESWILKEPDSVFWIDFELSDILLHHVQEWGEDDHVLLVAYQQERTKYQDNWRVLMEKIGIENNDEAYQIGKKVGFSKMILNLNDEILKRLKERKKNNDQTVELHNAV